jgi:membrane-bound lytic murein transglycosylase MltF
MSHPSWPRFAGGPQVQRRSPRAALSFLLGLVATASQAQALGSSPPAGEPAAVTAAAEAPFTVCMAEDNAPLSYAVKREPRGLDVAIARATAQRLGRPLKVVFFESEYEKESSLAHEVAALLSAGVCQAVSGFPLLASDLGAPTRASSRVPDHPGAKRKRERPYIPLQAMAASQAYQAVALGLVLREPDPAVTQLNHLGARRVGVMSGSLAAAVVMQWRQGQLRGQIHSLNHREDMLGTLATTPARMEAAVVPVEQFDRWRLKHPDTGLSLTPWRKPINVNLGFVTLAGESSVRAALDATVSQALADGSLSRWASSEGATWLAPSTPGTTSGPGAALFSGD